MAKATIIILALQFITWLLRFGEAAGLMTVEHAQSLETLDFWLAFGARSTLGVAFLWRLAVSYFKKD